MIDAQTGARMDRVVTAVEDVAPGPSVVTVGFFDGVHRGHQTIVQQAVDVAAEHGLRSVAVTFDRHPMEVLAPGSQPRYLTSLDRRCRTLLEQGLDRVLVVPFTEQFSRKRPEAFVDEILVTALAARTVVVGANFRFGHRAAGDVDTLRELGASRGFTVQSVGLLEVEGTTISSSAVRERLERGDVSWAAAALGRPYWLDGTVVRGAGRGRSIGIPTANLEVDPRMMVPANGVYAGWVEVAEEPEQRPAVVNIGTRPTFGGEAVMVEAHVLDVEMDLYGRHAAVGFAQRLRDEQRFAGPDELVAQIRDDITRGRRLLGV